MDDELKKELTSWKVQPQIPPDFQQSVWTRISLRELGSSKAWLFGIWAIPQFSLPQLVAFAILLGALAGTGLGLVESSQANMKNWKTLESKYVQSINPYEHFRSY